jgi:predicted small lipoprotein YifL
VKQPCLALLVALAILPALGGCGSKPTTGAPTPAANATPASTVDSKSVTAADLEIIWSVYAVHNEALLAGPANVDDLVPSFRSIGTRQLKQLQSGEVVLVWGVHMKLIPGKADPGPLDVKKPVLDTNDPVAKMVLGYVKDVPTKGGLVLMGDGKIVEMTAEDFKKATLAKPKEKDK